MVLVEARDNVDGDWRGGVSFGVEGGWRMDFHSQSVWHNGNKWVCTSSPAISYTQTQWFSFTYRLVSWFISTYPLKCGNLDKWQEVQRGRVLEGSYFFSFILSFSPLSFLSVAARLSLLFSDFLLLEIHQFIYIYKHIYYIYVYAPLSSHFLQFVTLMRQIIKVLVAFYILFIQKESQRAQKVFSLYNQINFIFLPLMQKKTDCILENVKPPGWCNNIYSAVEFMNFNELKSQKWGLFGFFNCETWLPKS